MREDQLNLLIVEDEPVLREAYQFLLGQNFDYTFAVSCEEAKNLWQQGTFDVVLLDINLPDGNGVDVLKYIRQVDPKQEILMCSGTQDVNSIVQSIKLGASEFLTKPIDKMMLYRALDKIAQTKRLLWEKTVLLQRVKDSQVRYHGFVGESLEMRKIFETIQRMKGTSTSALLIGESGVGKEVLAYAIHNQEENALRPFIAVNCAAIPEQLLESELFGHEKGAFTGAMQSRIGKFVQADGGDIFLDEIACMSPTLQAKLLRVLQDKLVEPLGGNKKIHSNFRVIAATNRNLKEAIEKREFRHDLYYRLQGVEIYIPPLRAHPEDIPLLTEHIIKELSPKFGVRHFTKAAMKVLVSYPWPGNVRELKNMIENLLILNPDEILDEIHLPPILKEYKMEENNSVFTALKSNIRSYEKEMITSVLKRYRGNKSRASKELGISRSILYRKMRVLGLEENEN